MDDLKERLDTLSPERRALLALLLKKKNGATNGTQRPGAK